MKLDNVRPERWNIMCSSKKNIIIASFNFLIFINSLQLNFHLFGFSSKITINLNPKSIKAIENYKN